MKYLEVQDLSPYNCLLDGFDIGTSIIYGKIEVYSCKQTTQDKRIAQELEKNYQAMKKEPGTLARSYESTTATMKSSSRPIVKKEQTKNSFSYEEHQKRTPLSPALRPPCPHDFSNNHVDPFGDSKQKRKTFSDLIATLNTSYPDYDFTEVKPADFTNEQNFQQVMNNVNMSLREVISGEQLTRLWSIIEMVVGVADSDIYSYVADINQDADSDPLALGEGKIWTWNYFFHNKKQSRLILFTCHAKSKNSLKGSRTYRGLDYDTSYSNTKNIGVHYSSTGYDSYDDEENEPYSEDDEPEDFFF
ncbi:hypothetical protein AKO1_008621 [Acrasis kona]|uniref:Repressor of RNA polymerase III transcription n=1 Tax=Acrasis kona TaxID=1008807 RepID=A0AAW2YN42_9EUKA